MSTNTHGSVIRRLSLDDVDVFRRIRLEALSHEQHSFASAFEDWAQLSDLEWRQHLDQPFFAAFLDCEPIGLMGLRFRRPRKLVHRAKLVSVYLRKSARGTGIATALLNAVARFARDHGVLQLELAVNAESLPAVRFYQRHGFVEVGRIPNGLLGHDPAPAELIMVLPLAEKRSAT